MLQGEAQPSQTCSPTCRRLSPDFALFPAAIGIRSSYRRRYPKSAKSADSSPTVLWPTTRWGGHECPLRQRQEKATRGNRPIAIDKFFSSLLNSIPTEPRLRHIRRQTEQRQAARHGLRWLFSALRRSLLWFVKEETLRGQQQLLDAFRQRLKTRICHHDRFHNLCPLPSDCFASSPVQSDE